AAAELAGAILAVHRALGREPWGTFHFCGAGETTWYGFARAIFEQRARLTGAPPPRLSAITTADYPTPALRPANSVLDCSRFVETFGHAPRPWQDALFDVLAERLAAPERPAREARA
ncbi:MAG TPA: sugar nucleotide-binding protein, partial [Kiloniellales bacterium]|nr:sugar nucleotide-binding protein [Kiloniellales bacterium]